MAKRRKKSAFGGKTIGGIIAAAVITAALFLANKYDLLSPKKWEKMLGGNSNTVLAEGELQVHYIDVGQGDCELIVSGDKAILIDTGEKENGSKIIDYLEEHDIPDIDCMLLTHPHSDHMGAAYYVIKNYDVGQVVIPKVKSELTPTAVFYERFLKAVKQKGLSITPAKPGMKIDAGEGELEIISPVKDYDDLNNYSAAAILTHGQNSFIFTGDLESEAEKDILKKGYLRDTDVLKVGHHGSYSSSSKDFLKEIQPDYAVISCGADNSYGHPHKDALKRIKKYTDKIYRTDLDGTIIFTSNKDGLTVKTEKQG